MGDDISGSSSKKKNKGSAIHFVAGGISGVCATILAQPLDVIKTRMIGDSNPSAIRTIRSILSTTTTTTTTMHATTTTTTQLSYIQSIMRLYQGTAPALARIVPAGMTYFGSVHLLKKQFGTQSSSSSSTSSENLTNFVIGASARSIATAITCPLMVVKTKFEYGQALQSNGSGRNTTMFQMIKQLKDSRSLFSGLIPSIVRDVPYSGTMLLLYEFCKRKTPFESQVLISLSSGVVAGSLATIITQPFDVVRTHLQIGAASSTSRGIVSSTANTSGATFGGGGGVIGTMRNIWLVDGPMGLFRGVCPRIVKRSLSSAISWSVYEAVVRFYERTTVVDPSALVQQHVVEPLEQACKSPLPQPEVMVTSVRVNNPTVQHS